MLYAIHQHVLLNACRTVGSQAELARRIGVSRRRLNNWINRGDRIPFDCLVAIERATEGVIDRHQLAATPPLENQPELSTASSPSLSFKHPHPQQLIKQIEHLLLQLSTL